MNSMNSMNSMNNKIRLYASQFIRIVTTFFVLYFTNIPLFVKIILIIIIDLFDCDIPRLVFGSENWENCNQTIYQTSDKITDTICYTLLLLYLLQNGGISSNYNNLIIFLFIYRLIGVFLFLIKNNRNFLFYFPNFFLEIILVLSIINYFKIFKKSKNVIILLVIIYKFWLEYFLHFKK